MPGGDLAADSNYYYTPNNNTWHINAANREWMLYSFKGITGVSAFGTHSGQISSVSGTTVGANGYCGFRPRFVIIKSINASQNWYAFDSFRDSGSPLTKYLTLDNTGQESTDSTRTVTFTNTGFTTGDHAAVGTSGTNYISIAFA